MLSAGLLHEAATKFATENGIPNPERYAFNGTFSLSLYYLVGLGFELYLKAAYIQHGGDADERHLKWDIGHDVVAALDRAEARGFQSKAPNLREIVEYLREPLLNHSFRYTHPDKMPLPDPIQVLTAAEVLDNELRPLFWPEGK